MENLTQRELREMLLLSYQKINQEKEQINKINVFPVPDQDTGNNLAKTLEGIKVTIEGKEFKDLSEFSAAALDGAISAAQGNAGVIYTGFLVGFFSQIDDSPLNAKKLAAAFEKGAERARLSIQNPKAGTILDVIDATSDTFQEISKKETDIVSILKAAIGEAKEALLETREKMEIFQKANVVDAGGLGFLLILESYLEALEGGKKEEKKEEKPSEQIRKFVQFLSNRFEVVALIENPKFSEKIIQEKLKRLGNSLDIIKVGDKIKLHIHTDYPNEVRDIIEKSGEIKKLRIEDMAKEMAGEPSVRKVSIGIVTDDLSDLPEKISQRYQIEIVKSILDWPESQNIAGENIYQKMKTADKNGIKTFPKTSQATPKSYLMAFEKQLKKFDKVLCITPTSKLSGCYNSAKQAQAQIEKSKNIFILDSLNGTVGQALLILRAIELIQEQREITEVLNELKNLIPKIHIYVLFEDPKWIEAGGRATKSQANWIRRIKKLNLHPLITIKNGGITKDGIVFAKDLSQALFKKIKKESKKARKEGKRIRVLIAQADNVEAAEKLRKMLKEIKAEVPFISLASPVVGAHTGPGTLIASWTTLE